MSTTRSFLLVALAFVAFLNYEAWQKDYAPQPTPDADVTPPADSIGERIFLDTRFVGLTKVLSGGTREPRDLDFLTR